MKKHLCDSHCSFVIFRTALDGFDLPQCSIYTPDFEENTACIIMASAFEYMSLLTIQKSLSALKTLLIQAEKFEHGKYYTDTRKQLAKGKSFLNGFDCSVLRVCGKFTNH